MQIQNAYEIEDWINASEGYGDDDDEEEEASLPIYGMDG